MRPKGSWVPGRESFERSIKEFELYPVGNGELLQDLQQGRHLGQGWLWEGSMVLTGRRRERNIQQDVPQSISPTSQAGKNSWEFLWDKNSCGRCVHLH